MLMLNMFQYIFVQTIILVLWVMLRFDFNGLDLIILLMHIPVSYAKQKHLGCKKGKANQKQQLSDYTCD